MYGHKAWDIVGYVYQADMYCPDDIIGQLPTGPGQKFDGWKDVTGQDVEANLDEIAYAAQINRKDETSFDSGDFPKVIFASDVETSDDRCGTCHESLIGE